MRRMNTKPHPHALALATTTFALLLLAGCATPSVPLEGGAKLPPPVVDMSLQPPRENTGLVRPGDQLDTALPPIQAATLRRTIYFDFDSADIRADSQRDLEALAQHFRHAQVDGAIVLEGHADERGGREYNLALGQKRAEAVRRALALLGVSAARMEAISWGEEKPAQAGKDEHAWNLNRRVELPSR
jgi:peptidoglycan-associated lipoprotein